MSSIFLEKTYVDTIAIEYMAIVVVVSDDIA